MEDVAAEIDRCLARIGVSYESVITSTIPGFVRDYSDTVFTKVVQRCFTRNFVQRRECAGLCGSKATQRCHGRGEERPVLLGRVLRRMCPAGCDDNIRITVKLRDVVVAFLKEHKHSPGFGFKCAPCHRAEHVPLSSPM